MPVNRFVTAFLLALVCSVVLACQARELTTPIAEAENNARPISTPTPQTSEPVTIAAVGDIMLGSPFPNESRMPPNDGADILKDVTPVLSAADIAFGNMEGPIIDGGISKSAKSRSRVNRSAVSRSECPRVSQRNLKAAGFDVMSVANNHASDFGEAGRAEYASYTRRSWYQARGSDRAEFSTAYLTVNGRTVAFVGFAHNAVPAERQRSRNGASSRSGGR
jgi:hypothetical protein